MNAKPFPAPTSWSHITPPASQIITVADARKHLRLESYPDDPDADETEYITSLIASAGDTIETYTRRPIRDQVRDITIDRDAVARGWLRDDTLVLNNTPIREVRSITYRRNDQDYVVPVSDYRVVGAGEHVRRTLDIYFERGTDWSRGIYYDDDPDIHIVVTCGYTDGNIPPSIIHACRILVADLYRFRSSVAMGSVVNVPRSVSSLLNQYRRKVF